ncbi:MAG: hypothetical protein M3354_01285 [Chloroflexota bacterium]|nr:hypothetical protein [Chloroflexota bacterium]
MDPPPAELAPTETESTVGTGSLFAIGCSLVSLLIIVVGIVILVWLRG